MEDDTPFKKSVDMLIKLCEVLSIKSHCGRRGDWLEINPIRKKLLEEIHNVGDKEKKTLTELAKKLGLSNCCFVDNEHKIYDSSKLVKGYIYRFNNVNYDGTYEFVGIIKIIGVDDEKKIIKFEWFDGLRCRELVYRWSSYEMQMDSDFWHDFKYKNPGRIQYDEYCSFNMIEEIVLYDNAKTARNIKSLRRI